MPGTEMDSDKRSGIDRRRQTRINIRLLVGNGNRRNIRRQKDRGHIFLVDRYSAGLFLAIVGILFLCITDAVLTLFLLNHGAHEINPLMAYLLNIGPSAFIIPKYGITMTATFCLFMFRGVVIQKLHLSTHTLLYLLAWVYVAVVGWELYLVSTVI
jgi:hypothetical protein